jgi:hypothetical protein
MTAFTLGKDCVAYFNSTLIDGGSNTHTSILASATAINNIKDLTLNLTKGETDISTRGDSSWTTRAPTLKDATISTQIKWLPGDAFFEACLNSYLTDDEFAFYALDAARSVDGAQGPAGNWAVFNFTRNENLTEAVMVDVELKMSSYPDWFEVVLGS